MTYDICSISLPLRFTSLPFFLCRLILISNVRLKLWHIMFIKFKSLGWGRGYLWRGRNQGGEGWGEDSVVGLQVAMLFIRLVYHDEQRSLGGWAKLPGYWQRWSWRLHQVKSSLFTSAFDWRSLVWGVWPLRHGGKVEWNEIRDEMKWKKVFQIEGQNFDLWYLLECFNILISMPSFWLSMLRLARSWGSNLDLELSKSLYFEWLFENQSTSSRVRM